MVLDKNEQEIKEGSVVIMADEKKYKVVEVRGGDTTDLVLENEAGNRIRGDARQATVSLDVVEKSENLDLDKALEKSEPKETKSKK